MRLFAAVMIVGVLMPGCATEADKAAKAARREALIELLGQFSPEERRRACDLLIQQQRGECAMLPRTLFGYSFQRPVVGVDGRPVDIADAEWDACDRSADMLARLDPSPGTDVYVYTLESSVYLPNPNSGTTVDQRYEMGMRSCLVRQGYRMVPSYQRPLSSGPAFDDYKRE